MNSLSRPRILSAAILAFVFVCIFGSLQFATAAPQIFNNEAAFLNATGPLSFEGYEGLPANNSNTLSMIVAADFTVTSSNSGLGIFNTPIAGQFATEGTKFLDHQTGTNVTTTFTFDFPIDAFGFDLIDFGDFGTGQLRLTNNVGDNVIVAVAGNPDGNVQYFGIISDFLFTQAILTNTISGEAFAVDRTSYGNAVPEPITFSLWLIGLPFVVGLLFRRRSVT